MMRKTILYVVTAVLLGTGLMLTPLWFLTPTDVGFLTKESQTEVFRKELAYGVAPQHPPNEISVGLMSTFSLVLAFVVFKQSKKKTL